MGTVKYSGPVASFHCPTEATIRSLKVHFSPKQEGTGDPSPENVRPIVGWDGVEVSQRGKNLYSKDNVIPHTADDEWNCIMGGVKQKIAVNSWPRWTFIAPAIPNATYYWTASCYDVGFLDKDKNVLTYKSAWSNTSIQAPANAAYVYHTWIKNKSMSQEQLDAAFETYDLYCDISSTIFEEQNSKKINYEFGVLGKNKLDKNSYKYLNSSIICFGGDSSSEPDGSLFLKAGTYTFSVNATGFIFASDANKQNIVSATNTNTATFTLSESMAVRIGCFIQGATDEEMLAYNYQLELGSSATTYEPYNPNKTVYGGWVDLITGEVCEEWGGIYIDGTQNTYISGGAYRGNNYTDAWFDAGNKAWGYTASYGGILNTLCDTFNLQNRAIWGAPDSYPWSYVLNSYNQIHCVFNNELLDITSEVSNSDAITKIKAWAAENPFKVMYKLSNEKMTTYHLAPTQLQTFLGQNNVWSNADYVEVEYDLHETQSILARK